MIVPFLADPNIVFLLTTLAFYGLIFELTHPGAMFPGIVGLLCVGLTLVSVQTLHFDTTGLALVLLGLACMTAEAFIPAFGAFGLGGAAAFAFGGYLLFGAQGVSPWLIGTLTLVSVGLLSVLLSIVMKSRRRPVSTGAESLVGAPGEVVRWSHGDGDVHVAGATWKARGPLEYALKKGDKIKVVAVDGLCLVIEPRKEL